MTVQLYCGDCLEILPGLETESVDAVITDPPYPEISRDYGRLTESEWWELMVDGVVPEVRRILKPTGSAVFILQPNSKHVGQMRGWLWEFMAWVCREWNMVQDAYWWNTAALPVGGAITDGLLRGSLKPCVWCGDSKCYRDQDSVLWTETEHNVALRKSKLATNGIIHTHPSGRVVNSKTISNAAVRRGGVTPYNVIPIPNNGPRSTGAITGHGAGTPMALADWWVRYICPTGGTVLDPFVGSGTMALAAIQNGCNAIGIDKMPEYIEIARQRIAEVQPKLI